MKVLHEKWSQYTIGDLNYIHRSHCRKCPYVGTLEHYHTCDYILLAGHSRGCTPEECEHYKDKVTKRRVSSRGSAVYTISKSRPERYWTAEDRAELIAMYEAHRPYMEIANKLHRSYQAIRRQISDYKRGKLKNVV